MIKEGWGRSVGSPILNFNELVETYSGQVFNLAFRITGNKQDAEDVVQETFLQVFTGLPSFRGESHPYTWIYRIAVNAALKVKRGLDRAYLDSLDEKIEAFGNEVPAEVQEWYDEPEKAVYLQALLAEVNQGCLHFMAFRLTDEQRVPYIMRMVLGFTYREIAEVLQVSENVVKARLHRAHDKLEKFFRARCQWLNPDHASCSCKSRVPFALAFDPELLGRVRLKARETDSDPAYIEFVSRQVDEIGELYSKLPHLAFKAETLKSYLAELQKKTERHP